ncbi:MAG: Gfo/Idh/MocA family oxidoreductase [Phycisphaerae bacterium]|nr:Gfo/Idh/MocA family oxidoreductase [Phycisphaerae bacterium]
MLSKDSDTTHTQILSRRAFLHTTGQAAALATLGTCPVLATVHKGRAVPNGKKIRVGIIGCGSVSWKYIPNLKARSYIDLVSCCDIIRPRAEQRAKDYQIPHVYGHIDEMLKGVDFDLLVNTTSMTEHYKINKIGLQAGKHVWSEKSLANSVRDGQELIDLAKKQTVGFWAAPCMVTSPQFEFMARTLAAGKLGRLAGARAFYGHNGHKWLWAPEFFKDGGGSLYDLGVYNITTLTGLLGPARRVTGLAGILHPEVTVTTHEGEKVKVEVNTDENAQLLIDHGHGVFSQIMTGFSLFDRAKPHDAMEKDKTTIEIFGDSGVMDLVGYDWGPVGVDLATEEDPQMKRWCTDTQGFEWQQGAAYVAKRLLTGERSLVTAEHALHCLEIMIACRESSKTGRHIDIRTTFDWPVIKA